MHLVLIASLEKAIWNWMDTYPHEFTEIQVRFLDLTSYSIPLLNYLILLQKCPNADLSKCCEQLFDILDLFAENNKRRAAVWPLQIMLLVISPKVLEEIVNADSGAPCSPRHSKKKTFLGKLI